MSVPHVASEPATLSSNSRCRLDRQPWILVVQYCGSMTSGILPRYSRNVDRVGFDTAVMSAMKRRAAGLARARPAKARQEDQSHFPIDRSSVRANPAVAGLGRQSACLKVTDVCPVSSDCGRRKVAFVPRWPVQMPFDGFLRSTSDTCRKEIRR
jgi:hypothetical protein